MRGYWSGKQVVVPGGAGFIGSSVVDALVAAGARVRVIDDLSSGRWERLEPHGDRIERVEADLTRTPLDALFRDADAVLNLAGRAPGLMLDDDRHQRLHRENLELADAILAATIRTQAPRLLVVSSSCVYPDDAPVPTPELPLDGTEPEAANRGYGLAKREIEARATAAHGEHTAITIARPFNACGPRDQARGPGAHVIPSLLGRLLDPAREEIVVWGSGDQTRSFIDTRDLATALLLLVEHHPVPEPVNVGSAEEITMRGLVTALGRLGGIDKPVRFDTSKPEGAARKGCDAGRLRALTGFRPAYRLADSLAEIVAAAVGGNGELAADRRDR